jgi:hypothetical protein
MAQINTTQSGSEQAANKVRPVLRSIPEQPGDKTAIRPFSKANVAEA